MTSGVSIQKGLAYQINGYGMPVGMSIPPGVFPWPTDISTIMVPGFNYDPWAKDDHNPHFVFQAGLGKTSTFDLWRRDLAPGAFGLGWYSVPMGPRNLLRAWRNGRWNRYRWAWDLAWVAGGVLSKALSSQGGSVDVLCHSLGSRVVLAAMSQKKNLPIRNLVIMNGAELTKNAIPVVRANPQINVTNLIVKSDRVLKIFGSLFAPEWGFHPPTLGRYGLGGEGLDNWKDIDLDDPNTKAWAWGKGWEIAGDNPESIGDHWYTYKHHGNFGLIRAALGGKLHNEAI